MGYYCPMGIRIFEEHPLAVADKPKLQRPPMYQVLLLNDDFTPMDFVVDILRQYFHKSESEATRIMFSVHHDGKALCGTYPREIAESKVVLVREESRKHDHPLACIMRKEKGDGDAE